MAKHIVSLLVNHVCTLGRVHARDITRNRQCTLVEEDIWRVKYVLLTAVINADYDGKSNFIN